MSLVYEVFKLPGERLTKGEFGVEIEVEGENLPGKLKYWTVERDGSLNENGLEYVLAKPSSLQDTFAALEELEGRYKAMDSEIYDTVRAGIHVHINTQSLDMVQLHNFILTYLIFENLLVSYCGESREGNLFCLRAKDAKALPLMIRESLKRQRFAFYADEDFRYASINLMALHRYGSLEFRAMRSTNDFDAIRNWILLLKDVKDFSLKFDDPTKIVESLSQGGFHLFAKECFGERINLFGKTDEELTEYVKSGARISQSIAYATDWGSLKKKFEKPNRVPKVDLPPPAEQAQEVVFFENELARLHRAELQAVWNRIHGLRQNVRVEDNE